MIGEDVNCKGKEMIILGIYQLKKQFAFDLNLNQGSGWSSRVVTAKRVVNRPI